MTTLLAITAILAIGLILAGLIATASAQMWWMP